MKIKKRWQMKESAGIEFKDASLTEQNWKEECDICSAIHRLARGLDVNGFNVNSGEPIYGDFSDVPDFVEYQQIVAHAKSGFENLPSKVRDRFDNSIEKMFDFLGDENNREEAIQLGLIEKPIDVDEKVDLNPPQSGSVQPSAEPSANAEA